MATFPKITNPCPYKGQLSDILDENRVCSLCHRQVHDLSAMTERQRVAFLKACSGETCVSYRRPAAAAAAIALAASAVALPAAAQEAAAPAPAAAYEADDATEVGGIVFITASNTTPSWKRFGAQTVADGARKRWEQTHRVRDSGKARREKG